MVPVYAYIPTYIILCTVLKYCRNRVYRVIGSLEEETCCRSTLQTPSNMTLFHVGKGKAVDVGFF